MKRKMILVLLSAILLTACANSTDQSETPPTAVPTTQPTATPTMQPTATPTTAPTPVPTAKPTAKQTPVPTDAPPTEAPIPQSPTPENTTGIDFNYCGTVKNDVTGNWRLAKVNTDSTPLEYALEYYNNYFESNNEIHAIINYDSNTTVRIQVLLSTLLSVTELKHIEGEENDAKLLFSGDVIEDYVISIETGEIVDLSDD